MSCGSTPVMSIRSAEVRGVERTHASATTAIAARQCRPGARGRMALERDDFWSTRYPALAPCLSMISFRKPVPTFRDHALAILLLEGLHAFGPDVRDASTLQFGVGRFGGDLGQARTRQLDGKVGDDPPGAGTHDQDPVGEEDRLVNVVRHEQYCGAEIVPD